MIPLRNDTLIMHDLIADQFMKDPRVSSAKNELLQALQEYQANITDVRPPLPERETEYAEMLREFGQIRGGELYYPYIGSGIGNGPLVELADGSVKYDMISGIGVHPFGHSHPEWIEASLNAALGDVVMQGNLQQNEGGYFFSKKLISAANISGAGFQHCFLTSSGAMAGENGLKVAFQKKFPAARILVFEGCFMGRTLSLSQLTDKPAFRVGLPTSLAVDYVPFFDLHRPEESRLEALAVLKKHLRRYPGQHAAMSFELILGEGGYYTAPADFHRSLMDELKEHGIAILADEVQTFGRMSHLFAFQALGLDQYIDVAWVGKASQVCATLISGEFRPKPGLLSQTYTASSTAIATGNVMLDSLLSGDYFGEQGKNERLHRYFVAKLEEIRGRHSELLEGPYGAGAMVAFTPLGGEASRVTRFARKLFRAGVIAFAAGSNPTRIRFLLPVGVLTTDQIDRVAHIIEETLLSVRA